VNVWIRRTQSFSVPNPATPDDAQRNTWPSDMRPRKPPIPRTLQAIPS
jgi:hypothetical protein